ncbi:CPBP family intramembrane glutamic endopeptidase [Abyssisolibacter fermentans]|uniref:CPBP family intramembrane glutamic endopeptidase n=1 Tax=Abyssisolibacter fermentans TaxID=1766203 RepID=UPI00082D12B1|nr:CPBP family intramembrane glutamic endopeptidase [Abyssisolibacter fermentans]
MIKILKMINPFKEYTGKTPESLYIVNKVLGFILIYGISALIGEAIVLMGFSISGYNILNGEMPDMDTMLLVKYYGFIIYIVSTILYCKLVEKRSVNTMGFSKNNAIFSYIKGLVVAVIVLIIAIVAAMITGSISYIGVSKNIDIVLYIAYFGGFFIQGMAEEVMCRGFLMTSLLKRTSVVTSVLVSSLVFAYPHFSTLFESGVIIGVIGIINLMLFSVFLSLYMIKDGNIWVSCAIHSIWNFLLAVICGINVSGSNQASSILAFSVNENLIILNGGKYGLEASVLLTIILVLCIILIFTRKKKKLSIEKPIEE